MIFTASTEVAKVKLLRNRLNNQRRVDKIKSKADKVKQKMYRQDQDRADSRQDHQDEDDDDEEGDEEADQEANQDVPAVQQQLEELLVAMQVS